MNKEIQDLAWSILPKEFKEEVKKIYSALLANIRMYRGENPEQVGITDQILWERTLGIKNTLCRLFGEHNLTSDGVGEEMLSVSRERVQNLYNYHKSRGHHLAGDSLIKLFGPKCLPDNVDTLADNVDTLEQKPADLNADRPTCTDVCSSKIDGRRLRIAAQMIKAIMGSPEIVERISSADPDSLLSGILHDALYITDALIAECMTPTNNN